MLLPRHRSSRVRRLPSSQAGFTLLELVAVIAIIGILALMIFQATAGARKAAECVSKISKLTEALRSALAKMKEVRDNTASLSDGLNLVKEACRRFKDAKDSDCYKKAKSASLDSLLDQLRALILEIRAGLTDSQKTALDDALAECGFTP